jgi:hypothetical protein
MTELISAARANKLSFDNENMWVHFVDGRILGVPLSFFPRLRQASPKQRAAYMLSGNGQGLHWEALDEDISVEHLLRGNRDSTVRRPAPTHRIG